MPIIPELVFERALHGAEQPSAGLAHSRNSFAEELGSAPATDNKSSASLTDSSFSKVSFRTEQPKKVKGSLDGIRVQLHRKGGG